MTARETFIVGRIDRRRECSQAKEDRTARRASLQARADSIVACEIGTLPANDHRDFSECLAVSLRRHLVIQHGEQTASTILSREAGVAGQNILPRKIAAAEAERLFTKAANDGGVE